MAYFIDFDNKTVYRFKPASNRKGQTATVKLDNGRIIDAPADRLFAVHPDENENITQTPSGEYRYKGKPFAS